MYVIIPSVFLPINQITKMIQIVNEQLNYNFYLCLHCGGEHGRIKPSISSTTINSIKLLLVLSFLMECINLVTLDLVTLKQ